MKLVILAALATAVLGQALDYYEPDELDCCCVGCGDPNLVTYDGAVLLATQAGKYLLSTWGGHSADGIADQCKYGFRTVTKADIDGVPTPMHYDWVGIGFGQKFADNKNWRNALMGQDINGNAVMGTRGEGTVGVVPIDFTTTNPYSESQGDCTWTWTLVDDHLITMRSTCCPYAFNWRPNGVDTCWQWYVASDKYTADGMNGMCGDCNGSNIDDFRLCPDGTVVYPPAGSWGGMLADIDTSCTNGIHQGFFFDGGTRVE